MGTAPILDIIMSRMLNFYLTGLNNNDNIINFFFRNSLLSNSSYVSTNISKILGKFDISYVGMFSLNKNKIKCKRNEKFGTKVWRCNMIEELMNISKTNLTTILDRTEANYMLNDICITH